MLKKAILLSIVLFLGQISQAQKDLIRFQNITIDNGLAQGSITGIIHGKDGYIWIATADGLHRYDGYSFKIYRNDPQNALSLPDNYISCLFEDSQGNILVGLFSGEICIFNKNTSTFKRLNISKGHALENANPVTCINEDGLGNYLIGYDGGGFAKYDTTRHKGKVFNQSNSTRLKSNSIRCILKDNYTGKFLIGSGLGIYEYNAIKETLTPYITGCSLDSQIITSIVIPEPNNIMVGTHGQGLFHFKRGSDSAIRINLPKSKGTRFITFLLRSPNRHEIWIGTLGGIIKWEQNSFVLYANQPINPESLVDNNTQTATIDRFGSLWIGTVNGLSRFDRRLKIFNLYREFKWKDSLLNNNVYCIYEDPLKNIWMGTLSSGIIKFNPHTEKIMAWPIIAISGIETRMVRAIFMDRDGQLWIGSRDKGLFKFYPDQNRFVHVNGIKGYEISSQTIRSIYEDHSGVLWIGTANGLNRYNKLQNRFEVFRAAQESPNNNSIYQIGESSDGKLLYLACFRGGFQIFNKLSNTFKTFSTNPTIKRNGAKNYAMCFEMLNTDSAMIGTYGGGLCIINLKNNTFRSITEKQGLANNSIYGILRQGNNFWLSTNRGLSCYNSSTHLIRNFGLKNYIQSNEYNEGAYCKTSDGTFYFGGVSGFNYFNPLNFPLGNERYITAITRIKKGEEEVLFTTNKKGERSIKLHYNDNLISFEFATLNLMSSQTNTYAYMLEGFDEAWIRSGQRTTAYYTKLSPGHYTFRVKSLSVDSLNHASESSVSITIDPPFWRTWWFYTLIILSVLLSILWIVKWRTQIITANHNHKLAELELKALRSQMNPHFIFNSLNSIQYFILKKEPKAAYDYLTKFSNLMRMILQNSKFKSITLKAEHDWLKTYLELENLRMENTLHFSINLEKDLDPKQIFVPTMVLQPYVENAIIHGLLPKDGVRNLDIDISVSHQNLKCIITDNGIGRVASNELNKTRLKHHESTAMNLTKDRLAILNIETGKGVGPIVVDLKNEHGHAIGTKVELILPLIIKNDV